MHHRGCLNQMPRKLGLMTVNKTTWKLYQQAIRKFTRWRQQLNKDWNTEAELDELISAYINTIYRQYHGHGRTECSFVVCGFHKLYPRFHFSIAKQALCAWSKKVPSQSYPPMSWDLAVLVARQMAIHGKLRAGILTLLMHDCYLRIGEGTRLQIQDIVLPGDVRIGSAIRSASISIAQAKTGANQAVTIRRGQVMQLLSGLARTRSADSLIGDISSGSFRTLFKQCCRELHLQDCHFVPHSLRHGGALTDYMLNYSVEDIKQRGRWQRQQSMQVYFRTCQRNISQLHIPRNIAHAASHWASHPIEALQDGLHHQLR
jgi:integrase